MKSAQQRVMGQSHQPDLVLLDCPFQPDESLVAVA